jgi:hypothetical protein
MLERRRELLEELPSPQWAEFPWIIAETGKSTRRLRRKITTRVASSTLISFPSLPAIHLSFGPDGKASADPVLWQPKHKAEAIPLSRCNPYAV